MDIATIIIIAGIVGLIVYIIYCCCIIAGRADDNQEKIFKEYLKNQKMREPTKEEKESVEKYVESISILTEVNFFDKQKENKD